MKRKLAISIGAAAAVLAAGGGVAALTWPSQTPAALDFVEPTAAAVPAAAPAPSSAPELPNAPVRTAIKKVDLTGQVDLPQQATQRFSMLSVSWTDPKAAPKGTVQVRTRSAATGAWTGWQSLGVAEEAADRPDEKARVRGRTEPLWAGPSNGVAARILGASVTGLPAGLRLNLIDPDARPTGGTGGGMLAEPTPSAPASTTPATPTATTPAATTTPAGTPTTTPTTTPPATSTGTPAPTTTTGPVIAKAALPPIVTRAQWGADETTVRAPASVATEGVKLVWVHHSGFGNNYTCAQSASVIRGIMANDIAEGFDDIGYNFIVDKCGTLYEGRKGSATKAVIGAHTAGFNTATAGVALLGDYTSIKPYDTPVRTISQVAAARLTAYGFDPATTTQLTEGLDGYKWPKGSLVTFPRIAGHKDGAQSAAGYLTECPGDMFYPLLGVIRGKAALPGLAVKSVAGTVSSGTTYVRNTATVTWTLSGGNVNRFNVLRDGAVVATVAGTARSATVPVTPGAHTIAVRAIHAAGVNYDTSAAVKIFSDVTAPTFPSAPSVVLRTGTASTTSVPVAVTYRAADNVRVTALAGKSTSPTAANLAPTSTTWNSAVRPNVSLTYTLTARDLSGNSRATTVTRKITQVAETSAGRAGTWSTRSGTAYLGGKALASGAKNAKLSWTFNGRSAALTFARATTTGAAYVYVDGVKVATIDTKAAATAYRQTLFVRNLPAKVHTVSVVVAGTSGRPTVIVDGMTYAN
ncbi:hypothetical protein Ade02nite_35460 [Paractinoplanes deccanensis]|uniref:Peptidoglycan recognition protein family domain-containing protein n=1 Tax=Paractinoplanes deccanensis TaxID=113561 RepID=A0ABQ3Y4J4_9ACTN|nr:N-acetylmuramoyl-L-alanine amidase [Actinoplanes deccanensis]GID74905.1 hypothetical protein Ade02nite_35460 [Actinoplanes deccanensis]